MGITLLLNKHVVILEVDRPDGARHLLILCCSKSECCCILDEMRWVKGNVDNVHLYNVTDSIQVQANSWFSVGSRTTWRDIINHLNLK